MNYVKISTGECVSKQRLIKENSHMSLPKQWTPLVLEALGVAELEDVPPPEPSGPYKQVIQNNPVNVEGVWKRSWSETDMFEDTESKTKEEQEIEYQQELDEAEALRNRGKRGTLLLETDWWASSDLTMTAEQTAYRQALRDITTHANWPHLNNDDWPTKP